MKRLKKYSQGIPWLIPGIGFQGGSLEDSIKIESSSNSLSIINVSRDIIYSDDFEGEDIEWTYDSGWQLTGSDYNSPSHSFNSPNDASTQNGSWNLLSPVVSLPQIGPDDFINFGFHLYNNQVDSDGDGDNFLEDYYSVSMMDPGELAWHASSFNAYEGMSYWCGKEEVDGYLDSWLQYLDTPPISIPSSGYQLKAQMAWGIEDPTGASVAGSCTDGWDAANVRISMDGGNTWELLTGSDAYDFINQYIPHLVTSMSRENLTLYLTFKATEVSHHLPIVLHPVF